MNKRNRIEKISKDMVDLYHHLFPKMDLEFVVKSRKKPIMDKRHIIRYKLKQFYGATLEQIAEAEAIITGDEKLNHSSIINSEERYHDLEEKAQHNSTIRKDIHDVDTFITFLHSPHHQFLTGKIGDTSEMKLSEVLNTRSKHELMLMCEKLESYGIVRRSWFEAALDHVISEHEAESVKTASDE